MRHVIVDGEADRRELHTVVRRARRVGQPPTLTVDTASPALLLVSGGTTGAPKLIPRTHDDYGTTSPPAPSSAG